VNVAGEPAPDKRWLSNGKELVTSDRIKIVYTANNTKIFIRSATRKENGTLTLTAENVNGSDTCDVSITVIDVPGAPMGPLIVKDMTAQDCQVLISPTFLEQLFSAKVFSAFLFFSLLALRFLYKSG